MRFVRVLVVLSAASALLATPALAARDRGRFATAASGFMQAYDKPAQDAAMIRIDEITRRAACSARRSRPGSPTQDRSGRGRQCGPRGARPGAAALVIVLMRL